MEDVLTTTEKTETSSSPTTVWNLDNSHSHLDFSVKHMLIAETSGKFTSFGAEVKSDAEDFTDAEFSLWADVHSITTESEQRDGHLKSDDFFNAEEFPKILFTGKGLEKTGENTYKVHGKLKIREIEKDVIWNATLGGKIVDPYNMDRVAFNIKGEINRFDYNLKWNGLLAAGGAIVSDKVKLNADLQFVKPHID
ncbi:MAG: YceI family protein [Bacteroidetes bacterium]|nr:YceI family protein [Bacteroidota bacterium]